MNQQQYGGMPPQQGGFQAQPYGAPQQPGYAPQQQAAGFMQFEDSYEDLDTDTGPINLNPGVFGWPVYNVEVFRASQTGNAAIRINFFSGEMKSKDKPLLIAQDYYILDKELQCLYFKIPQVERMRNNIYRTFGVRLEEYFIPVSPQDVGRLDQFAGNLHNLIAGKYASVTMNWPKDANPDGKVYLEITWLNHIKDLESYRKSFKENPKPTATAAGATSVPGGPPKAGGVPTGGMPIAPPVQMNGGGYNPQQNMPNGSMPIAPPTQQQQPQQQYPNGSYPMQPPTPNFQQPAPQQQPAYAAPAVNYQQPTGQPSMPGANGAGVANPYQQPAQPFPNVQAPPQPVQQPAYVPPVDIQSNPITMPAPNAMNFTGGSTPPPVMPQAEAIPHLTPHPTAPHQFWNAAENMYMFLEYENGQWTGKFTDLPF